MQILSQKRYENNIENKLIEIKHGKLDLRITVKR